jgi:Na+-driven multidrug efflux pump
MFVFVFSIERTWKRAPFKIAFQSSFVTKFIGIIAEAQGGAAGPVKGLFGAHMVTVRWESFSFLPGFAMGTAAGALAGQYLGAGSVVMARRAIWACLWIAVAMMGTLGIAFLAPIGEDKPGHWVIGPDGGKVY